MIPDTNLLLTARELGYGTPDGRPLVEGLSFTVRRSEVVVIQGPNGVGKSTLLRVIRREVQPHSGTFDMQAASTSYLPQLHNRKFHLPLTLRDVVRFGSGSGTTQPENLEFSLLNQDDLGLGWNTASGGERQKALLTRVLAESRDLIILDEPTNHLDQVTRQRLIGLLLRYVRIHQNGVLMVCHDQVLSGIKELSDKGLSVINLAGFGV